MPLTKKESTKKVKDTIVANGKIKSKAKKEIVPENILILQELLSQTKYMNNVLDTTLKELLLQQKEVTSLLKSLKERFV